MPSWRHQTIAAVVALRSRWRGTDLDRIRRLMWLATRLLPLPKGVERQRVTIGSLVAERLLPRPPEGQGTLAGSMLYLHGGGYCLGSIATHRALASRIARATGCEVLLPGYRLAPEHPHPAALEDARRAYDWLRRRGEPRQRLLVGGDSAGGGLALALLLVLREEGELPAGSVHLSPWTDLTLELAAGRAGRVDDPMVTLDGARRLAALYIGDRDPRDPLISPVRADLAGLPPLFVQVGTRELLLDDSRRLAQHARRAGVDVELQEWPEMMHVWQAFAPWVPESVLAIEAVGAWARRRLAAFARREAGSR